MGWLTLGHLLVALRQLHLQELLQLLSLAASVQLLRSHHLQPIARTRQTWPLGAVVPESSFSCFSFSRPALIRRI